MTVFIKNGNFAIIEREKSEILEKHIFRGYSIVSQEIKNQIDFDKFVMLSNYLINIKFLGCSYDEHIMKLCDKMNKNTMNKL